MARPRKLRLVGLEVYTAKGRAQRRGLVNAACLEEFHKRIPLLCQIADGELEVEQQTVTPKGDVVTYYEKPTIRDRREAIETLGRFAGAMPKSRDLEEDDEDQNDATARAAAAGAALAALGAIAARLAGGHHGQEPVAVVGPPQSDHSAR